MDLWRSSYQHGVRQTFGPAQSWMHVYVLHTDIDIDTEIDIHIDTATHADTDIDIEINIDIEIETDMDIDVNMHTELALLLLFQSYAVFSRFLYQFTMQMLGKYYVMLEDLAAHVSSHEETPSYRIYGRAATCLGYIAALEYAHVCADTQYASSSANLPHHTRNPSCCSCS